MVRVKNAALSRARSVEVKNTKLVGEVALVLKREGYLKKLIKKDGRLQSKLAYVGDTPVLMDLKLVSKPGLRVYKSTSEIGSKKGVSFYILSTSKGVFSSREALKAGVGGEVVAEVW